MAIANLYDREGPTRDKRGPGWTVKTNERGVVVSRIRFWEHQDRRDPEWEKRERAHFGNQDFELMQGETYDVPVGSPYYELFASRTREIPNQAGTQLGQWMHEGYYIKDAPAIYPKLPVILGLDGGQERPALILSQYDKTIGCLWAMRELRVQGFQAGEFIALVRYLIGQATIEELMAEGKSGRWNTARALAWIDQERKNPYYGWEMPWVPYRSGIHFHAVMAKHESLQKNQMAKDAELNSLIKLYAQQGLRLNYHTDGWDHRDIVAGFLLREGPIQGVPRGLFDSSCKWLIKGMAGGLVKAPPTQRTGGPLRDRKFEDTHDAWLNGACAVFPLEFADRLQSMEAEQARIRTADGNIKPPGSGLRWTPKNADPGASWGGMRVNYRETNRV